MLIGMTMTPTPTEALPLIAQLRARHLSSQLPDRPRRRKIREAAGASIREVAKACGVSNFSIYSWEKPGGTIEPIHAHRVVYKQVLDALEELAAELAATQK